MAMTVRALRGTMNEFTAMSLLFTQSTFRCAPQGSFNGRDVIKAMKGHILASASTVGTYTLNPKLLKNS